MELKTLREVTPNFVQKGIFSFINTLGVPWFQEVSTPYLNLEYYGNKSGGKYTSPLVDYLLGDSEALTEESLTELANICYSMYSESWKKLYETLSLTYNPLETYTLSEETTDAYDSEKTDKGTIENTSAVKNTGTQTTETSGSQTGTVSDERTISNTRNTDSTDIVKNTGTVTDTGQTENTSELTQGQTSNITRNDTRDGTVTEKSGIYGFNSTASTDSDTTNKTSNDTNESTQSTTQNSSENRTDNGTNNNTRTLNTNESTTVDRRESVSGTDNNTRTDNLSNTSNTTRTDALKVDTDSTNTRNLTQTDSSTRRITKNISGTNGNHTMQDLIGQERKLWLWTFFDTVFADVDKVLTIQTY